MRLVYIAVFGLVGVFARYYLGLGAGRLLPPPFPFGTFIINITGSFAIGVVYVLGAERMALSPDLRIGIMVGLLGGYTTFSSYCLEMARLIEDGEYWYAALYVGLSTFIGVAAVFLGMALTRKLSGSL